MIPMPSGVQVWLAGGHTDMRKGFDGLAVLVQEVLKRNPHSGHLFVFRGRRSGLIKVGDVPVCQAAGAGPFRLAVDGSWRWRGSHGDDHAGAARLFAGRDRLAAAAAHVASSRRGLTAILCRQRSIATHKRLIL